MVEGKRREAWDHTASILCYFYNANRGPKAKALQPEDFHPHLLSKRKRQPIPRVGIEALKVFLPDKPKKQ